MDESKSVYEWVEIAMGAARSAGDYLRNERSSSAKVTLELERDVKLIADEHAEAIIIKSLREKSAFSILTEETGVVVNQDSNANLQWIVDPLDGSLNYLRGIPICCVSIGLWKGDKPLLGVIYDFIHDDFFSGINGYGACVNGTPIHVSKVKDTRQAVLCTGFPVSTDFSSEAIYGFVEQVREYKKVRLLGSAAMSLAYVSMGLTDAYFERNIKIWDVAAGLAIVQAAGGFINWTVSGNQDTVTVYAGNSSLPNTELDVSE